MKRRDFLKSAALSSAVLASEGILRTGEAAEVNDATSKPSNAARIPRREYGKTGVKLSILGFGGIMLMNEEQDHANRVVAEAVERGVNYFDVAPSYGNAEVKLGPALEAYRENVFLACKSAHRDRAGMEAEFNQSLKHLRTDHFDLYQLHAITDVEKDVDAVFVKDGAMDFLIGEKKAGRVHHLGFSAHSVEAAQAALDRYDFDSVLFPINFATFYKEKFGPQVIELAQSKGAARLALKALARQAWPKNDPAKKKYSKCWYQPITDPHEAELAFRFTLSQPVTAAVSPGEESLFRVALELAARYKPLTAAEEQELKTLADKLDPLFHSA